MKRPNENKSPHITAGLRIREIREERGISQDELAALAGLDRSHLTRLETGVGPKNPGIETLGRIAQALGVRLTDLLAA